MPPECAPQLPVPPSQSAPGPESLIWRPESYVERIDLKKLFPRIQPLEVELGSGDGGFLAQWAALHTECNFIGIERLLGRLRKLDRKGCRAGLHHLRLLRIEASYFLEYLLPPQSVSALHVYFPDPWPKRKQRKHRLINESFTRSAAQALLTGGTVYLRTDDLDYFQQMTAVFGAHPGFQPTPTPEPLRSVLTDFEREFISQGIATLHAAYRKTV
jgi:tRNA (guanine-N7-)-methyltransferase